MKKTTSSISIAIICVILGYLVIHQFRALNENEAYNSTDIIKEIELLKKEKDELSKKQSELSEELKKYEDNAAQETALGQEIKKELDNARIELGLVPVQGEGVEVTLTRKSSFFGGNFAEDSQLITERDLVHLINLIWFAQAEAIELNDYRITPQIGIKDSGKFITVGSAGKVNPAEKITIKAIGDIEKLKKRLTFKSDMELGALKFYNISITEKKDIIIDKTTENINADHINSVK